MVTQVATVEELHARDPFGGPHVHAPEVWVCDLTDAALVLGSRQSPDLVDREACERAGLAVVRRRSGGGAVILRPGAVGWVDLVLPHGFAPDDVRGSMIWAGRLWHDALHEVSPGTRTVHTGGMVHTPWSELVCFAGIGPGEIVVDGHKCVGLSQRRTRHGIRIQGSYHRRAITSEIPSLLVGELPTEPLPEPISLPEIAVGDLADALAARLGAAVRDVV